MLKSSSLYFYSSNLGTFWLKIEQFWPFEEIRIVSDDPDHQPRCPPLLKIVNSAKNQIKFSSSETTGPIATKFWWNGPWMAPFQIAHMTPLSQVS
jgi:hypothetical protein